MGLPMMIGIAVVLLLFLIPVMYLAKQTTSQDVSTTVTNDVSGNTNPTYPVPDTTTLQCIINDECLFNEWCSDGVCLPLTCTDCEDLIDHMCQPIICDDDDICTDDLCSEGACIHPINAACQQTNTTNDECVTDLDCADGNLDTIDTCILLGENQSTICNHAIPSCIPNDNICGTNCTVLDDNDCEPICGNGVIENDEECDGACPVTVNDCQDNSTCSVKTLLGSASLCTAECVFTEIVSCTSSDGCCPTGCVYATDNDCEPSSTLLATGSFTTVQRTTLGSVEKYAIEDGSTHIVFDASFSIANTNIEPAVKVYLAVQQVVTSKETLDAGNYFIGELQAVGGAQTYPLGIIDTSGYNSVVIYHETYNAILTYATLADVP